MVKGNIQENKFLNSDSNEILDKLNDIGIRMEESANKRGNSLFLFDEITIPNYSNYKTIIDSLERNIYDFGYQVEVFENLEVIDATRNSRFGIRITDDNGTYTDIEYFHYREVVNSFLMSEYELISEALLKISGNKFDNFDEVVKAIVTYVSYACYFKEEQVKVYDRLGWMRYDGATIFKYDIIYYNGLKKDGNCEFPFRVLKGKCINSYSDALSPIGDTCEEKTLWMKCAVSVMNYSTVASIVIGAGVSGVIRQLLNYNKERGLNINILGVPASGKTTLTNFVLSIFGKPEYLEGSHIDTENAMEMLRGERAIIPYVVDDRMLKNEGKNSETQSRELLMAIFREYEGKIKERVGNQYADSSGQRMWSPVISTSVRSMLKTLFDAQIDDYGQYRRFMEFEVTPEELFKNQNMTEYVQNISSNQYGYGIRELVWYIINEEINDNDKMEERFLKIKNSMDVCIKEREEREHITGMKSSSQRFTLIVLSYQIMKDALVCFFRNDKGEETEEIKDKTEDIKEYLLKNLSDKIKKVKQKSKVRENIIKFVEAHNDLFYKDTKKWNGNGTYIGQLIISSEKYEILIKKNGNIGWLLVSSEDFTDEELKEYIISIGKNDSTKVAERLFTMYGDTKKSNFDAFMSKHSDEVTYVTNEDRVGNLRFDKFIVQRKEFVLKEDEKL